MTENTSLPTETASMTRLEIIDLFLVQGHTKKELPEPCSNHCIDLGSLWCFGVPKLQFLLC